MTCNSGVWAAIALNAAFAVWNSCEAIYHRRAAKALAREKTALYFPGASVLKHLESDKKEQK